MGEDYVIVQQQVQYNTFKSCGEVLWSCETGDDITSYEIWTDGEEYPLSDFRNKHQMYLRGASGASKVFLIGNSRYKEEMEISVHVCIKTHKTTVEQWLLVKLI